MFVSAAADAVAAETEAWLQRADNDVQQVSVLQNDHEGTFVERDLLQSATREGT